MNKYKKLVNNSIVFTIGTFGSQLISFLMVPLYTQLLTTGEYGTVDLINSTISLLVPFATLELGQAALRYSIESQDRIEQNKIFSNITTQAFVITVILLVALPILNYLNVFENYVVMFILLLILRVINNLFSQYIRGIGLVKEFALNGILMTFITVISNLVLLIFLNFKVEGYIISLILATLTSNIYLFFVSDGFKRLRLYSPEKKLFKKMLRFSIPIIPNSAMWWIINSSTRYFILFYIGATGNGIYAVANKIPGFISMITGIFSQAWQLSSFEEYESETKDNFYTKIFSIYSVFLFLAGSLILIVIKPLLLFVVEDSFYGSWQIAPLLIFAVIYQSFSSFLGTNYTAAKETKGTFSTSVLAGIISIISNSILIPYFGLIGAGISSALSFFIMFLLRYFDTRKYVVINIKLRPFILTNALFLLQVILLFCSEGLQLFVIEFCLFVIMLLINKNILLSLTKLLLKSLQRRR